MPMMLWFKLRLLSKGLHLYSKFLQTRADSMQLAKLTELV